MAGTLTLNINAGDNTKVDAVWDYAPEDPGANGWDEGNICYLCPASDGWGSSCQLMAGAAMYDKSAQVDRSLFADAVQVQLYANSDNGPALIATAPWATVASVDPPAEVPISDWSNVISLTAGYAPTMPPVLNLTGTISAPNWVLAWDKFDGATSYTVQVKHGDSGAWTDLVTVGATQDARQTTSIDYTAPGYVEYDSYSFRVRANGPA